MKKTCRHFRYTIPSHEADELRAVDPEPCEVCDSRFIRRNEKEKKEAKETVSRRVKRTLQ